MESFLDMAIGFVWAIELTGEVLLLLDEEEEEVVTVAPAVSPSLAAWAG
jgi:hypothetical protein